MYPTVITPLDKDRLDSPLQATAPTSHYLALSEVFKHPQKAKEKLATAEGGLFLAQEFEHGGGDWTYNILGAWELLLAEPEPCPHVRITVPVKLPCGRLYESSCPEWVADQQLRLGLLMYWGDDDLVEKDMHCALHWIGLAADRIHAHAMYSRGLYESLRRGRPSDELRKARMHGVPEASEMLWMLTRRHSRIYKKMYFHLLHGKWEELVKFYRRCCEDEKRVDYRYPYIQPRPCLESLLPNNSELETSQLWDLYWASWKPYWLQILVERGQTQAMEFVVKYDSDKFRKKFVTNCILELAERGDVRWQLRAARCYERGHGVRKKPAKSLHWLGKAAAQGSAKALFRMGMLHLKGIGTIQDHVKAYALMNVSCALRPGRRRSRRRDRILASHPSILIPGQALSQEIMQKVQQSMQQSPLLAEPIEF